MSGFRRRAFVPLQRQWLRKHHPDPLNPSTKGWRSAVKEGELPDDVWRREVARGLELGLPAASSIEDRDIPTFSRGELPHFAGINTFMKAPYLEDVRQVGAFDATVMGVPYDGGTTYRSGTRFGPQGIRRISALYSPYNYELGVDLREQMTLCDAGEPAPRQRARPARRASAANTADSPSPAHRPYKATSSPSRPTSRRPSTRSRTPWRTWPPPAPSLSSSAATTRLASPRRAAAPDLTTLPPPSPASLQPATLT